jgi:hypothetical protein
VQLYLKELAPSLALRNNFCGWGITGYALRKLERDKGSA